MYSRRVRQHCPDTGSSRPRRATTIMTMAAWSVLAAGHVPDTVPVTRLQQQLAALLSDPAWGTLVSSWHADGEPPVRAVLHEG